MLASRTLVRVLLLMVGAVAIAGAIYAEDHGKPASADNTQTARMALNVFSDTTKAALECGAGAINRTCTIVGDDPFSVHVVADTPPPTGFHTHRTVVQYDASLTLNQQAGTAENVWPDCGAAFATETKGVNSYQLECTTGGITNVLYTQALVNLHFSCPATGGLLQIDLIGGTTGGSLYIRSGIPSIFFLKSVDKGGTAVADAVRIECLRDADNDAIPDVFEDLYACLDRNVADAGLDPDLDTLTNLDEYELTTDPCDADTDNDGLEDGEEIAGVASSKPELGIFFTDPLDGDSDNDGCLDGREVSTDETTGGRRDPLNSFDYFDVNGDRRIDVVNDILPVIFAFGLKTGDVGYSTTVDRGPSVGPNFWNRSGPDGRIDVPNDILTVIFQFGHRCT